MLQKLSWTILFISLCSCASLPPPPKGDLCVIDIASKQAVCVPISAAIKRGSLSKADASNYIPLDSMDNYVAFSPTTWGNVESYIKQLKLIIDTQCQK